MEVQAGRIRKSRRQVIGDRVVVNAPASASFATSRAVIDTVLLSEVCGCGYSCTSWGGLRRAARLVLQAVRSAAHGTRRRPGAPARTCPT